MKFYSFVPISSKKKSRKIRKDRRVSVLREPTPLKSNHHLRRREGKGKKRKSLPNSNPSFHHFHPIHVTITSKWQPAKPSYNNPLLPFWAAAPKGYLTYAFTHIGNFLLLLLLFLLLLRLSLKPKFSRLGSCLLAGIWTSRLRFGPQGWDLGLQARILAFGLGFGP